MNFDDIVLTKAVLLEIRKARKFLEGDWGKPFFKKGRPIHKNKQTEVCAMSFLTESDAEEVYFKYKFQFDDGRVTGFSIRLDPKNCDLITRDRTIIPDWARLECCQCPNCPFDLGEREFCPVAENLVDLVEVFRESVSYESAEVYIQTPDRDYRKKTSLQQGISSILGIYMVTSGCPVLEKLKPMVRFHLPFATALETTYRAVSMYMVAQYLRHQRGLNPDWNLKGLIKIYDEVQKVNIAFSKRLKNIPMKDASLNAVAILDSFGNFVKMSINYEMLSEITDYFCPLLEEFTEQGCPVEGEEP